MLGEIQLRGLALALLTCGSLSASISILDLGTGTPPASLGGFTLSPFAVDSRGAGSFSSVPSPLGGSLSFDTSLVHAQMLGGGPSGDASLAGWLSWSHSYTGDVYYSATKITFTLPSNVCAFQFYADPSDGKNKLTVTVNSSKSLDVNVDGSFGGSGANGFGIYSLGGDSITTVTISSTQDLAVGEFAIATCVPEPSSYGILATVSLIAFGVFRRSRS